MFADTWSKGRERKKRSLFLLLLSHSLLSIVWLSCLADYLNAAYLSRLRSELSWWQNKIGFSQKIRDLRESLCPRIASAGQPCGFYIGRNCFVFVWSDQYLNLFYVSWHNGCLATGARCDLNAPITSRWIYLDQVFTFLGTNSLFYLDTYWHLSFLPS